MSFDWQYFFFSQASDETLHLVLETLQAAIKAGVSLFELL